RDARAYRHSVQQHGACAALPESAAESGAVDLKILLQDKQQGSRWVVNRYVGILPIDLQRVSCHGCPPSFSENGEDYKRADKQCQSEKNIPKNIVVGDGEIVGVMSGNCKNLVHGRSGVSSQKRAFPLGAKGR